MEENLNNEVKVKLIISNEEKHAELLNEFQKLVPSVLEPGYVLLSSVALVFIAYFTQSYFNLSDQTYGLFILVIILSHSTYITFTKHVNNLHRRIDLLVKLLKYDSQQINI